MPRKIIQYNPRLTLLAKEFRKNPTKTEAILWKYLKEKQVMGYDFHRQKPLGYYIVDFFCNELNLALEIDGSVHNSEYSKIKDELRQDAIEQFGVRFLRFKVYEIEKNIAQVINEIENWIVRYQELNNNSLVRDP